MVLTLKKGEYEKVLKYLRKRRDKLENKTARRQAVEAMIRMLDNQLTMIQWAIHNREKEK